jgi:thiol-disulfide isomerase/thioredoxin
VAPSDNDPSTPSGTPVPPRGAKRKPNRPTSLTGRSAGNRATGAGNRAAGAGNRATGAGNRATAAGGQAAADSNAGGPANAPADSDAGGPATAGANGGTDGPAKAAGNRGAGAPAKAAANRGAGGPAKAAANRGAGAATKAGSSGPARSIPSGGPSARRSSGGANSPAARRRAALAQQRRKRNTLLAVGAIAVVIVVVAVFVIVKVTDNKSTNSSTVPTGKAAAGAKAGVGVPVPKSVYTGFASVKPSALAAAANNAKVADAAFPSVVNDPPISTKGGLPVVFYFGAEFCPYCATERWAMVLALSQFGTFKNLSSIASTPNDSSGIDSVPTFTFYKSTYTSKYFKFEPVETSTVDEKTLQSPNKAQTQIVVKYDSGQTIPFVYFNGKAILSGAEYNPTLLTKGTFLQDAQSIIGGTSSLSTSVYFNAGAIVSDICHMTGGKGPANVCKAFPKPITG